LKDKTADKYLTVQSVAETLSCTTKYIYELIQAGSLKAIKIGERGLRISEKSLQEFIAVRVINPEDYFAPKELPASEPEQQKTKVARSRWMDR
jgi:excisionase family DNA binding protein